MLLALLVAIIAGISIGTFTGILPGIHINLVSAILLSISAVLLTFTQPIVLAVFIVALAITHTFVDFIPSIFLGAPNEDTALSVLPGHQLLLKGKAYEAAIITLYGCLLALPIIIIFTPLFIFFLPKIYPYVLRIMPIILILLSGYLIFTEKKNKKFLALIIFLMAGFLGIATLNLDIKEPLLPLFTGLFGASGLVLSLKEKTKIPSQQITPLKNINFSKSSFAKTTLASIITSPFTSFLPALGSSQAALIGTQTINEKNLNPINENENEKEFLFLLGTINIVVMALSFITLYSINKSRTGAAVAVSKLLPVITLQNLLIIITTITITGLAAFLISIKLAKFFSKNINKINYSKLSIGILILLTLFTIIFSGFLGFLVFIISTSLGITAIEMKIKRTQLMGCLLVPTILFYLL